MTDTNTRSESDGETRLPEAVVEDLLSDDGCRLVLACLADRGEAMAVDDLARAMAARERDDDESVVDEGVTDRYREAVFQEHLPRLTPTGVVDYDSMLATVALDTDDERVLRRLS
jgi:hypothetical protein